MRVLFGDFFAGCLVDALVARILGCFFKDFLFRGLRVLFVDFLVCRLFDALVVRVLGSFFNDFLFRLLRVFLGDFLVDRPFGALVFRTLGDFFKAFFFRLLRVLFCDFLFEGRLVARFFGRRSLDNDFLLRVLDANFLDRRLFGQFVYRSIERVPKVFLVSFSRAFVANFFQNLLARVRFVVDLVRFGVGTAENFFQRF